MTTKDPMHTSVCDHCYRGTWYEVEGMKCRMSINDRCECCGQVKGEKPCPGKLRLINRSGLAKRFERYYESGQRIRVRLVDGRELTGTVGKTMGWMPSYMLMARSDSRGSSDMLTDKDIVLAVKKDNGKYMSVYWPA